MSPHPADDASTRFRAAIEAWDHDALVATLAEDCTFHSPAVHKAYEGRDATAFVLAGVMRVLEDFRYTDELRGEGTSALRFAARVGEREIEGVDLIRHDADDRVAELTVLIRPLRGLEAVVEGMQAALAEVAGERGAPER